MTAWSLRHRTLVVAYAGFVAVSGWFGVVGLMNGLLGLPEYQVHRLPFGSPVFAGIALGCVVAAPTTWLTMLAWRSHPRTGDALNLCGVLLVGWIVVEVAFVREFSPLQPIYFIAGLGMIALGTRDGHGKRPSKRRPGRTPVNADVR